MKKLLQALFVAMFLLVSFLPLLQSKFHLVDEKKLRGFVMPKRPELPELAKLLDGSFQKKAERWFLRRHGFWGHLVRFDNQLNYEVFRQISSSYKASLMLGNEGWLYQTMYLDSFNGSSQHPDGVLNAKALQLKRLQELLAERGIGLLLVISTNKIAVHPEIVPARFFASYRDLRANTYRRMLPLLDAYNVNFFDTHSYFVEISKDASIKYFTPSGSHWNDVGACLVSNEIVSRMEKTLKKELTHFTCEPLKIRDKPRATDLDLLYIANLWDNSFYHQKTPYPKTEAILAEELYRPKVLFIGTSFVWSILRFLDFHKVYHYSDFLYYYNRLRNYPSGRQETIKREAINWEEQIFTNNFIVIEINLASIQEAGFEFLEEAIQHLEAHK